MLIHIQYIHHEMLFLPIECFWFFFLFFSVVIPKEEEDAAPNVRLFKSSHMSAKITYKEDFVPYSTRFLELFRPGADDTSGSQNDEK